MNRLIGKMCILKMNNTLHEQYITNDPNNNYDIIAGILNLKFKFNKSNLYFCKLTNKKSHLV